MSFHPRDLLPLLRPHAGGRLVVAYSGGLDSHVLLHAVAAVREALAPAALCAVHVDHGLSPNAAAWARHCAGVCRALGVEYHSVAVHARPTGGEGPEAAARRARYAALRERVGAGDCLLTAHHRGDQAETVLLQLLRGAGPHGLAAMPACAPFGPGLHLRPLLGYTRDELRGYAETRGLAWIEDESNADTRLRRNYLRQVVMPLLSRRWAGTERTLARAAAHNRDAAAVLDEIAAADLGAAPARDAYSLPLSVIDGLSAARRRNALRYWLRHCRLPLPAEAHMAQIEQGLLGAAPDRSPVVRWPGAELRRYRDRLYAAAAYPPVDAGAVLRWYPATGPLALPGGGCLSAAPADGAGLKADRCAGGVTVRFRRGGEHCRPAGAAHRRTLKNLFQERGIPPWERARVPLIEIDGEIAAVGPFWVCAPFAAAPGERGVVIHWVRG